MKKHRYKSLDGAVLQIRRLERVIREYEGICQRMRKDGVTIVADLQTALEESVKLQSHYAELLNMYDGGERIGFKDADAWITRLRECRILPKRWVFRPK